MRRVFEAIVRWRWLVVAFYAVALVPSAHFAAKVDQDSSVQRIIVPDDPANLANAAFQEVFGGGQYAVLLIETDAPESLGVLSRVHAFEQALRGQVETSSALSTYAAARGGFEATAEDAAAYARFVEGTSVFREQGLVGDGFLSIPLVFDVDSRQARDDKIALVEATIRDTKLDAPPISALRRVGTPYVNAYFDDANARSGPRYFGLFMAFVVILNVALYRSLRTLLAFLITLAVCLATSLGFIGWTGGTFTLVSPMVPMTILVTATATLVYLHSRFVERPEGVPVEEHHLFALQNKLLACTASIVAAIVGFAALMVSDIRPIRDMGLWVAVGLSFTWVIAFTLFPALQRILRTPTSVERRAAAPWLVHLAAVLPRFSYRWRWPLVSGAVLLSAAGVVSIFGAGSYLEPMKPLTEATEYVSRDTVIYQDTARARALLPGIGVSHVWLRGDPDGASVSDPPVLSGLHAFERALAAETDVGAVVGLPTVIRLMSHTAGTGDAFPTDEEALEDIAAQLEGLSMAQPDALRRFVDRSFVQTQLTILTPATEHERYQHLHGRVRQRWAETVAKHPELKDFELSIVGLGPLQAKMSQSLVPTLVESFGITAGIIFFTFLLIFRSGAARIMTMLPSLFAILVMFLVMRLAGMQLNIATILIASTVLGTSENDQIHFFYHFLEGRKTGSVAQAMSHTFRVAGRAIFFATLINAGGFMAFAVADMRPMQQFGTLTAIALVLAMLADFTALPAALWLVFRARPDDPAPRDLGSANPDESPGTPPSPRMR